MISIIVPVYNTEKYLAKCINSILSANFKTFEILLINDGSTDQSEKICKEFELKSPKIKYFYKENGGVASARNFGIKHAVGDWIYFVDSDDTLIFDSGNLFLENINDNVDIIELGFKILDKSNLIYKPQNNYFLNYIEFNNHVSDKIYTVWKFLFSKKLINSNDLKFTEGLKYAEDIEFTTKALIKADGIKSIPYVVYEYHVREGSVINRSYTYENAYDHLIVVSNLIDLKSEIKSENSNFLDDRIIYMIKSYFSFLCKVNLYSNQIFYSDLKQLKKQLKKIEHGNGFITLKLKLLFPKIYLQLMKIKIFIKKNGG